MDNSIFFETKIMASDNTPVRLVYDRETDTLEMFFGPNQPATGIELTDHILLRLDLKTHRAISVSVLHFSILSEPTEYGPRSYAINKIDELPEDLREIVFKVITTMPVRQFLKVTHFQASAIQQIPVTYVESQPALMPL